MSFPVIGTENLGVYESIGEHYRMYRLPIANGEAVVTYFPDARDFEIPEGYGKRSGEELDVGTLVYVEVIRNNAVVFQHWIFAHREVGFENYITAGWQVIVKWLASQSA